MLVLQTDRYMHMQRETEVGSKRREEKSIYDDINAYRSAAIYACEHMYVYVCI